MKTYPILIKAVKKYVSTGLIILVTLIGFTFKANAQNIALGNDVDKINDAMLVQVADHDFDILIPKVSKEELETIQDAKFNQMVYVVNENEGFYFYLGSKWEKQGIKEVFELINMNMAIQLPDSESLIMVADKTDPQNLLDYNDHVKHIYQDFAFDKSDNTMAINVEKE